jgi:hypothetical protein
LKIITHITNRTLFYHIEYFLKKEGTNEFQELVEKRYGNRDDILSKVYSEDGKQFNAIYRGEYFYAKLFLNSFPQLGTISNNGVNNSLF